MRERGAIAGAVVAAVGCAGVAWGVLASGGGCQLQKVCDPATTNLPFLPKEPEGPEVLPDGFPVGAGMYGDVWQSGPIEGHWLWFPPERTYVIKPQLSDGGAFVGPYTFPQVLLSADPNPYTNGGSNFAQSAGNTAEFAGVSKDTFQVTNNTCSPYYLWLQVAQEYPSDGAAPVQLDGSTLSPADGGDGGDAGGGAGTDAGADSGGD